MAKTWAERNPHPGAAPPRPPDEAPLEANALQAWHDAVWLWNNYVVLMRRHELALDGTIFSFGGGLPHVIEIL